MENLNVNPKTMKLLQLNIGEMFYNYSKGFANKGIKNTEKKQMVLHQTVNSVQQMK
jgi:hypothetical protein